MPKQEGFKDTNNDAMLEFLASRKRQPNALQAAGNALAGFAAPFTGATWKPLEPQAAEDMDYSNAWNEFQSRKKFETWLKMQKGEKLNEYENKLIGLDTEKDKTPSDYDLYKNAQDLAYKKLGGSMMVGINEQQRGKYDALTETEYLKLKRQFNKLEETDYQTAASKWLKRKGYAITPNNVSTILSNNQDRNFLFEEDEPTAPQPEKSQGILGLWNR